MGPETQCCHLQDIDIFIGIMIKLFLLLGSTLKLSSVIVRPAAFILDEISIEQLMQKLPAFEQSHFFLRYVWVAHWDKERKGVASLSLYS